MTCSVLQLHLHHLQERLALHNPEFHPTFTIFKSAWHFIITEFNSILTIFNTFGHNTPE